MTETDQELYTTDATAYIDPDGADDEGCEGPSLYEHYRVEASKNQEFVRVDKFLISHLSGISRNRIQKAADAGFIMCNDRPVKRSYKVKPCDVIKVMLDRPSSTNRPDWWYTPGSATGTALFSTHSHGT